MPASSGALARLAIAVVISACAPVIDGPIEHQRALDRDDGGRLGAQIAQLPGVVTADVVLHRAMRDPLAPMAPVARPGPLDPTETTKIPPAAATLRAVITIDDRASPAAIRAATERLARAALPELGADLAIEIHASTPRPQLARVGPFSVEASSQAPLKAVLVIGCLAIAALAGALARSSRDHRRGNSAQ